MKKLFSIFAAFFAMFASATPRRIKNKEAYRGFMNADSVAVTSAYAGDVADVLFTLLTSGNQAVEKGSVYVEPNVQKQLLMPRFNAAADQLQDRSETPTVPSDSFTYDERTLVPLDCMFYDTVNPRNFEDAWRPFQPTGPLVDRVDNPKMQAAIILEALNTVGTQIGKLIWQGNTAAGASSPLRFFDGFQKILETPGSGAIAVTPAGVITQANVISIMEACEAAIPAEVWEDPNTIFHMNTTDYRHYLAAARALDFKGPNIEDAGVGRFAGKEVRFYTGMGKDHIIVAKATAGKDSNLWAGVDVLGDEENVKIARYRPESELFIVKVLFKYAVQVGNPTETVYYKPA